MITAQAAKHELWRRGDLRYRLEPHQLELYAGLERADVELVYADFTRRGGKTDCAVTYCCSEARKSKTKIRYATAFQTDLIEFIKPAFETVLEDCPDDLRPTYLESKKRYDFPGTNSEIKLIGLDKNPNGLRGNGIRIIVIDEAGFVSNLKYLYDSVIIPATARRKHQAQQKIKIIIVTTPPPDAEEHYCYQLKVKAQTEPNGFYIKKTLDDVSTIADEEKERLLKEAGGRESATAKREYFCIWMVDPEMAICPTFDATRHVREVEWPIYGVYTFVCDTGGVRDKTAAHIVCYSHELGKVLFLDEVWFEPHTATGKIIPQLKAMCVGRLTEDETKKRNEVIPGDLNPTKWLDASGQLQVDYADAGFGAALPPKDEFSAGLTLLRNAFYNDEVLIHPRCKLLIATLSSGLLNRTKTDFARTDTLGHCDAAASAIYGLRVVDRKTDHRPGPSSRTHHISPIKKKHPLTKLAWPA